MIKRTPQEIADFFGCYVAQDKIEDWYLYRKKPSCDGEKRWKCMKDDRIQGFLEPSAVNAPGDHEWTHLYEPSNSSEKPDHLGEVFIHQEYCLLTNIDQIELVSQINKMMAEGWLPQGGIAVEHLPKSEGYVRDSCFYQAMVRGV